MRAFPGIVIGRLPECFDKKRTAGEWKHRDWLADPHLMRLQFLLPFTNLYLVVVASKDQIGLYPGDALPGVDQQFADPPCIHAAILVQLFPALFGNGLDS